MPVRSLRCIGKHKTAVTEVLHLQPSYGICWSHEIETLPQCKQRIHPVSNVYYYSLTRWYWTPGDIHNPTRKVARGDEDVRMWRCEDVKMRRCEDEKMWSEKMSRWEDVKMRRCEDEKMWRWEDVKMRRCEDEKMWRWEDVKMRRCEDEMVWRWEDEIQTPTIGRTLRSDASRKKHPWIL